MEISKSTDLLVNQVTALAWLRACLEVGITFPNKETGENESNELRIYDSFLRQLDLFDLPDVKINPKIIEKNIYEVLGSYLVYNKSPDIRKTLVSVQFMEAITGKLDSLKKR